MTAPPRCTPSLPPLTAPPLRVPMNRNALLSFSFALALMGGAAAHAQEADVQTETEADAPAPPCAAPWIAAESSDGSISCVRPLNAQPYFGVPFGSGSAPQPAPYPMAPAPYPSPYPTPYAPYPTPYPAANPYPTPYPAPYPVQPAPAPYAPGGAPTAAPAPVIIRPLPPASETTRPTDAAPSEPRGDESSRRERRDEGDEEPQTVLEGVRNTFLRSNVTLRGLGLLASDRDGANLGGFGIGYRYGLDRHWSLAISGDVYLHRDDRIRFVSLPISATAIANFFPLSSVSPYAAAGLGVGIRGAPWGDDSESFGQILTFIGGGLDIKIWNVQLLLDGRYMRASSEEFRADGSPDGIPSGIQILVGLGGRF